MMVRMGESLGSEGIWRHALGARCLWDVEDTGVDEEWRLDVTSGPCSIHNNC